MDDISWLLETPEPKPVSEPTVFPGWYKNPVNPDEMRYWDGTQWTDQTHPLQNTSSLSALPDPDAATKVAGKRPASKPGKQVVPEYRIRNDMSKLRSQGASVGMRFLAYILEGVLGSVTFGIGWLIWAAVTVSDGQTPAKKILGLQVIKEETGQPASPLRMIFVRGILAGLLSAALITLTLGIILFMPLWDEQNRNIWDRISGCRVIQL